MGGLRTLGRLQRVMVIALFVVSGSIGSLALSSRSNAAPSPFNARSLGAESSPLVRVRYESPYRRRSTGHRQGGKSFGGNKHHGESRHYTGGSRYGGEGRGGKGRGGSYGRHGDGGRSGYGKTYRNPYPRYEPRYDRLNPGGMAGHKSKEDSQREWRGGSGRSRWTGPRCRGRYCGSSWRGADTTAPCRGRHCPDHGDTPKPCHGRHCPDRDPPPIADNPPPVCIGKHCSDGVPLRPCHGRDCPHPNPPAREPAPDAPQPNFPAPHYRPPTPLPTPTHVYTPPSSSPAPAITVARPTPSRPTPQRILRNPAERDRARPPSTRFVPDQIVALIRSSENRSVEEDVARAYRLDLIRGDPIPLLDARMQVFRIRGGRSVSQAASALSSDRRVFSVQPNFLYQHQGQAGDGEPASRQYSLEKLGVPQAHKLSQGRGIVVAVIDSAIDATHPDLKDAVIASYDASEVTDRAAGADGADAHGTAIAGVIRGQGFASGVAPGAQLLAVRAFSAGETDDDPQATTAAIIRAIQWSVDNGADVLNMSFTGPKDPGVEEAINWARGRNVITVAAAGNGGPGAPPAYPAAYPQVIAVTAVDDRDRLYKSANQGKYIAVAAPGVDILAPANGGSYRYFTGTSFAAAEVSGVMALLLERKRLDPNAAREVITVTADSLSPHESEEKVGAGRVNAYESLLALGKDTTGSQ